MGFEHAMDQLPDFRFLQMPEDQKVLRLAKGDQARGDGRASSMDGALRRVCEAIAWTIVSTFFKRWPSS